LPFFSFENKLLTGNSFGSAYMPTEVSQTSITNWQSLYLKEVMLCNQLSIHIFEALPVSSNGLSYSNPAAISNLSDSHQW